jgi:hypothetical protein
MGDNLAASAGPPAAGEDYAIGEELVVATAARSSLVRRGRAGVLRGRPPDPAARPRLTASRHFRCRCRGLTGESSESSPGAHVRRPGAHGRPDAAGWEALGSPSDLSGRRWHTACCAWHAGDTVMSFKPFWYQTGGRGVREQWRVFVTAGRLIAAESGALDCLDKS